MHYPPDISLPQSTSDITLGRWIDFTGCEGSKAIEDMFTEANKLKGPKRQIRLTTIYVEQAYNAVAFFNDMPLQLAKQTLPVEQVTAVYRPFSGLLSDTTEPDLGLWTLPAAVLTPQSPITLGQFIDAKIITQAITEGKQSKWELLQYLCAIFLLHKGEPYHESFADDSGERFAEMTELRLDKALAVMRFYEELNTFLAENFSLFQDSGEKSGANMRQHFERWGWVNFLKNIAKAKVFDIPVSGMNSIECARQAKLYEVMIYASEDKDYNIAYGKDMEAAYRH